MPRIDAHTHLIPEAYKAELDRRGLEPGYPLPPATPELLVGFMDEHGIDASVVSLSPPGVWFGDAGLAKELARLVNEATAAVVREQPARFAGLATLPLPDAEAAVAEIAYALDTLGLDGVALLSNVGGTYLGDPALDPVFDELDRRGAYAFVHPVAPATPLPLPGIPPWVGELPFDTTRAAANLIYSGTLERCPNVRLQLAHLGGATPFLAHRIAELAAREPERGVAVPAGAAEYLGRLYYDTGLSNNATAVAATRAVAGVERIVFGSDWPFLALPAGEHPGDGLDDLGAADRQRIDGANLAALVPRLAEELSATGKRWNG
jgi:predicted TIM-barrel fold metal-dependent hydrolase